MKAIIFDIDGTLLDTTEYIFQSFENSLKEHGFPMVSREDMSHTIGEPLDACYRAFSGQNDIARLIASHHAFELDNFHLSKPYNSTADTLKKLKSAGLHMGALTSRASDTVHQTLSESGIDRYIDYVLTFDDVTKHKPDPEGIYKNLHYFGVCPTDALMVGDSPVDVLAGKNAGTRTVGVTYGFHGDRIIDSDPNYVIGDIAEMVGLIKNYDNNEE